MDLSDIINQSAPQGKKVQSLLDDERYHNLMLNVERECF